MELEEPLERLAERIRIPDLAGDDETRLERLPEDFDELGCSVVDDVRRGDLRRADLQADELLLTLVLRGLRLLRLFLGRSAASSPPGKPASLLRLGRARGDRSRRHVRLAFGFGHHLDGGNFLDGVISVFVDRASGDFLDGVLEVQLDGVILLGLDGVSLGFCGRILGLGGTGSAWCPYAASRSRTTASMSGSGSSGTCTYSYSGVS